MDKIASTNPLHDPTAFNTMTAIMNEIRRGIFYDMECCRPGIVEEYNRETHVVGVRPLVKHVDFNNEASNLPVQWMTLQRMQIGGFLIDLPVHVGDVGWMIATDRNAEFAKYKNNKIQEKDTCKLKDGRIDYGEGNQGPQSPGQYDMHSFLTGFFIPDSWSKIKMPEGHEESLVISTVDKDGKFSASITITPDGVIDISSDKGAAGVLVNGKPIATNTYHSGSESNIKFAENPGGPFESSLTSTTGHVYINAYYV